jgi:SpoIID/LytB domain protein
MIRSSLVILLIIVSFFLIRPHFVYSDELDDITKKIEDLSKSLAESQKASAPHEATLTSLKNQLASIEREVAQIEEDIEEKRLFIEKGYEDFAEQKNVFDQTVRSFYIKNYSFSPLLVFVSSSDASLLTRLLAYQKRDADQDKATITNIAIKLADLEQKKSELESEETKLAAAKTRLSSDKESVEKLVLGAREYQSKLSSQIADLSAKQKQLIAQKLGSLNLPSSLGAGPLFCTDDRKLDPGFSGFAFFTFGIPHRVGMNQYGAQGRANAGQGHEDILRAYFDNFSFENRNARIKVQGYGEMDLEEYLLGIYEMPDSFPTEALKAQVIAARSYALSYTNNGEKEICTTQSCQVYKGGNKGGNWEKAVKDTAGKTMVSGGQPITAWFASTAGGYLFQNNDVWGGEKRAWTKRFRDTNGDVSSFSDLISKSYDKDSPCLYAAQGYRTQYAKSAWLKPSEVADMVNVILLARADGGTKDHLYQTDKTHPYGGEVWNEDRVKQELRSRNITPFNSISDISVSADFGGGTTTSINLSGDSGSQSFSGSEFRDWFNLRAPANIQIVGPLFNVERR